MLKYLYILAIALIHLVAALGSLMVFLRPDSSNWMRYIEQPEAVFIAMTLATVLSFFLFRKLLKKENWDALFKKVYMSFLVLDVMVYTSFLVFK